MDFVDRTRRSYDALAADYADRFADDLDARPLDRALLSAFAELVRGPVLDLGCGTGRVSAHLKGLGVEVSGMDLSPGMLEQARSRHPGIDFRVGSMLELDARDLGGVLLYYSAIHVPAERLPDLFARVARALVPGGWVLLAFQTDSEPAHYDDAWGIAVDLDFHRHDVEQVCVLLEEAGLAVTTRVVQEPGEQDRTRQGYVLATRRG